MRDRLDDVLDRCTKEELLPLATCACALAEPDPAWQEMSENDLRKLAARTIRRQGSADVAYFYRRIRFGEDLASAPYEEIVEDVLKSTNISEKLIRRLGEEFGDHLYVKEVLFTLYFALFHPKVQEQFQKQYGSAIGLIGGGLKAIRSTGFAPYKLLMEVSSGLAKCVAGRGLSLPMNAFLTKALSRVLGPVAAALCIADVAQGLYKFQAPNLGRCALAIAMVGAFRMKYYPVSKDKMEHMEAFIGSLEEECPECGKKMDEAENHCLVCFVLMHKKCGTEVHRLDTGEDGSVCSACRRRDLNEEGILVPDSSSVLTSGRWVYAAAYQLQAMRRSVRNVEQAVERATQEARGLKREIVRDFEMLMKKAFGYLYVMFFTTLFLSILGIGYFKAANAAPGGLFNPGTFFRISLVITVAVPTLVWFIGAMSRAMRNSRRADFERQVDGKRLGFRDYLFGFLYYESPVENIWGPIALIGMTVAVIMWLLFNV